MSQIIHSTIYERIGKQNIKTIMMKECSSTMKDFSGFHDNFLPESSNNSNGIFVPSENKSYLTDVHIVECPEQYKMSILTG